MAHIPAGVLASLTFEAPCMSISLTGTRPYIQNPAGFIHWREGELPLQESLGDVML